MNNEHIIVQVESVYRNQYEIKDGTVHNVGN